MKLYRVECSVIENEPSLKITTLREFIFSDFYEMHKAVDFLRSQGHSVSHESFLPDSLASVKKTLAKLQHTAV